VKWTRNRHTATQVQSLLINQSLICIWNSPRIRMCSLLFPLLFCLLFPLLCYSLRNTHSSRDLKKAGIQGLSAVIRDQNMSKLETEATIKAVFPTVFSHIEPPEKYSLHLSQTQLSFFCLHHHHHPLLFFFFLILLFFSTLTREEIMTEETSKVALATFQDALSRSSLFSLQWIIQSLFRYLSLLPVPDFSF